MSFDVKDISLYEKGSPMQKPVCSLILGLFVVYMNANGMQENIASSAIEPAAQRVINVVSESCN